MIVSLKNQRRSDQRNCGWRDMANYRRHSFLSSFTIFNITPMCPFFNRDHLQTMIENKRQLCFSIISLLSNNPRTVLEICEKHQEDLVKLSSSLFSHAGIEYIQSQLDFPMQCTLLEVLYRLFLTARSFSHTPLMKLLQDTIPIDVFNSPP